MLTSFEAHHPLEVVGRMVTRIREKWTCLEIVLWSRPIWVVRKSAVQFTGFSWIHLQMLHNIPAVQFSSVRIAAVMAGSSRNSQASTKSAGVSRRDQDHTGKPEVLCHAFLNDWRLKSKKPCKASSTSKPLSQATGSYLYSRQTACVLHGFKTDSAHECVSAKLKLSLYQLTSLCQSAQSLGSAKKPSAHHQKFFGAFLSMESWQMEINYAM